MSGAAPLRPSMADVRKLLHAARGMEDAWGAMLELCLITLGLPWEIAAIDLERIDWGRGTVPVPARGGVERILALSHEAQRAVLRICGSAGGHGQVVTAGRGPRMRAPLFRLDRLLDRLAEAAPDTIDLPEWNFHGVRATAAIELATAGAGAPEIDAVIGRQPPNGGRALRRGPACATTATVGVAGRGRPGRRVVLRGSVELATTGAERWSRILRSASETAR